MILDNAPTAASALGSLGTGGRGVGITDLFAGVSDAVIFLFGLITQLGDPWFLFVIVAVLYWAGPQDYVEHHRRTWGVLTALAVGATALTVGLKAAFALPRPPGAATSTLPGWLPSALGGLYHNFTTGDGFGFPSGHAIGSAVVYGGMAALLTDFSTRRRRALVAAGLVGLVTLSRLVLGVHYLADVVVGVAVGLAFLAVVLGVSRNLPARAFGASALVSLFALGVTAAGGHAELVRQSAATLGGCLGGLAAWLFLGTPTDHRVSVPEALVGLLLTGGLWMAVYVLEPAPAVTAVGDAVAVASLVAFPDAVEAYRASKGDADPSDPEVD